MQGGIKYLEIHVKRFRHPDSEYTARDKEEEFADEIYEKHMHAKQHQISISSETKSSRVMVVTLEQSNERRICNVK